MATVSPRAAGLVGPFPLRLPFNTAAGPVPEALSVKMPGVVGVTPAEMPLDVCPRNFTCTVALRKRATSYGTTADTCVLLAYRMGERKPLISTCTLPRVVETRPVLGSMVGEPTA